MRQSISGTHLMRQSIRGTHFMRQSIRGTHLMRQSIRGSLHTMMNILQSPICTHSVHQDRAVVLIRALCVVQVSTHPPFWTPPWRSGRQCHLPVCRHRPHRHRRPLYHHHDCHRDPLRQHLLRQHPHCRCHTFHPHHRHLHRLHHRPRRRPQRHRHHPPRLTHHLCAPLRHHHLSRRHLSPQHSRYPSGPRPPSFATFSREAHTTHACSYMSMHTTHACSYMSMHPVHSLVGRALHVWYSPQRECYTALTHWSVHCMCGCYTEARPRLRLWTSHRML